MMRTLCGLSCVLASISACSDDAGIGLAISEEPPGEHCAAGGVKLETGPDTDGDGAPDSVESTQYLCDGVDGEDGADAVASISEVAAEEAGANCAEGGLRIDTGADADGSGTLSAEEIASTQYVCNGASEIATLTAAAAEPAGDNCAAGGVRLDIGLDADDDGVLSAGEVTSTQYLCNGDAASGSVATSAYTDDELVSSNLGAVTAQSASLTVPGSGQIVALGTLDAFCSQGLSPACGPGTPRGVLTIADVETAAPTSGAYSYFNLTPDVTESVSRTAIFDVPAAGTYSYFVRGVAYTADGSLGFYRRQLTLIYLPD